MLSILKDIEIDRLARDLAALTGETLTAAIRTSLAERLERERFWREGPCRLLNQLEVLSLDCAALPNFDNRSADEIVGYDDTGMWT